MKQLRATLLAWLAAVAAAAMGACSHAPQGGPPGTGATDDDPWVVRGSVEAGPTFGKPTGPYSPR